LKGEIRLIEEFEATRAHLTLMENEEGTGFGIGCELYKKLEESAEVNVYHIFSLYLDKKEYPTKRRALHYALSVILRNVLDEDRLIIVTSKLSHMSKKSELKRKTAPFRMGKEIIFVHKTRVRRHTDHLAKDAIKRRDSISERLIP
jgi:hypothetical protein